jgi:hypothetical protein
MFVWKSVSSSYVINLKNMNSYCAMCITFFHLQKFDLRVEYNKWQKLLSGSLYEYLGRWLGKEKDKQSKFDIRHKKIYFQLSTSNASIVREGKF